MEAGGGEEPGDAGHHADDLIADRALRKGETDAFKHEALAESLAACIRSEQTPLNVARFGAWGAGKSSVYELLRRTIGEGLSVDGSL